jgi:hypothetical protein
MFVQLVIVLMLLMNLILILRPADVTEDGIPAKMKSLQKWLEEKVFVPKEVQGSVTVIIASSVILSRNFRAFSARGAAAAAGHVWPV